ncbi:hypothetical protein AGMMS49975_09050 [Clostridia bacterium]|nr:hypothetical protein AGMMS49975_09050 [Clostridia bacterium]
MNNIMTDDYFALRQSSALAGLTADKGTRFDSAEDAVVWFSRELDDVKAKTYDRQYPELNALRIFPVSSSVNPGAETTTYYAYDITGMADFISNYSDDLPRADVFGEPQTVDIRPLGSSYQYSIQDIRASRYSGKSLDARRGEAARKFIDRLINRIAWCGDKKRGLRGVLSDNNNVPIWTPSSNADDTSTKFTDKTPDEILADFSGALQYMSAQTNGVEVPDTIAIDQATYIYLATTPRSSLSDTTILKWLQDNLPGITFERAGELSSSSEYNPFTGQNVMVIYKNDPDKLEIEIPLMFNQLPAEPRNLAFVVNCEARIAGAIIYYPFSMLIVPGI